MGTLAAEVNQVRVSSSWTPTLDLKGDDSITGQTVNATALNPSQTTYTQTANPKAKYYSGKKYALVAGALTIDLTALSGLQASINGTGLKVQALRVRGCATGNGKLTISEGAANPYELFGGANPIEYPAGNTYAWQFEFGDKLGAIGAGAKNIDLAGTGTNEFYIEFLLGLNA